MDGPTLMNLRAAEIGTSRLLFFLSDRKLGIGKEEQVCLGEVRENNRVSIIKLHCMKYSTDTTLYIFIYTL